MAINAEPPPLLCPFQQRLFEDTSLRTQFAICRASIIEHNHAILPVRKRLVIVVLQEPSATQTQSTLFSTRDKRAQIKWPSVQGFSLPLPLTIYKSHRSRGVSRNVGDGLEVRSVVMGQRNGNGTVCIDTSPVKTTQTVHTEAAGARQCSSLSCRVKDPFILSVDCTFCASQRVQWQK